VIDSLGMSYLLDDRLAVLACELPEDPAVSVRQAVFQADLWLPAEGRAH
jgi:hypothetical protein